MYVRLSQTIGQNLCITVISHVTNTTQALHTGYAVKGHVTIHQVKHCMLAGIDSKSSASGMQQIRVLHLSGTQKTPV